MRFGVHVRVSGGYQKAIDYAASLGCTAVQIFSSNPRSYRVGKLDLPALQAFAEMRETAGIDPCVIHTPYLINLASDDPKVRTGSLGLLRADLASAAAGEIAYVNTHLGSYGTRDREEGFAAICAALEDVLADITPGVMLVLENSAGAGNLAGGTLEELGRFIKTIDHPQLGVCLDTAHAWAAGYRIDSRSGV
ncbi:MAG TPA: TIM barrel protein, partial [Candidatus Aquilonibacter sp.]